MPGATLPIRLLGMTGLQKDVSPHDVPASGLVVAKNVRIKDRAIQAFSDVAPVITVAANESLLFADGIFRDRNEDLVSGLIVVLADENLGAFQIEGFSEAFAVSGQIVVFFYDTDGNRTDISPTVPFTLTEEWFGHRAGVQYLLCNSSAVDVPHLWQLDLDPLPIIIPMPGWPATYTARFMVGYKNFLVAGGLTIAGVSAPGRIKWSHPVSIGDVTTFWDFTDPTILAGENPLIDNVREMVALHPFKDLLMIYFDRAVWRMSLIGGQQVFAFERAFSDDGAVSARSMVEVEAISYVFGRNDVYTHDGYSKSSISDLRVTRHLQNSIDVEQRIDAIYHPVNNEVLFLARSPGQIDTVDGNLVFIYNLVHDAWTEGDLSQEGQPSIALFFTGPTIIITFPGTWDSIQAEGTTWDQLKESPWGNAFASVEREALYALSLAKDVVYNFEAPAGQDNVFRELAVISHTKIDLDELGESVGDRILYVNRVYPQLTGEGSVIFRFGTSKNANDPVNWTETVTFKIAKNDINDPAEEAADYACDVRMAGRYLAYEMKPVSGSFFALSGLDIELDGAGEQ